MKFGLKPEVIKTMAQVFQQFHEIKAVKIFGSRAIGNYRDNSDIDLAVYGEISEKLLGQLKQELEELPFPYQFDVKAYTEIAHQELRQHIDKYGQIIY